MGQWGTCKTENGFKVIPHVNTAGFAPATYGSVIDEVYILDYDKNIYSCDDALKYRNDLRDRFVGKLYSEWKRFADGC